MEATKRETEEIRSKTKLSTPENLTKVIKTPKEKETGNMATSPRNMKVEANKPTPPIQTSKTHGKTENQRILNNMCAGLLTENSTDWPKGEEQPNSDLEHLLREDLSPEKATHLMQRINKAALARELAYKAYRQGLYRRVKGLRVLLIVYQYLVYQHLGESKMQTSINLEKVRKSINPKTENSEVLGNHKPNTNSSPYSRMGKIRRHIDPTKSSWNRNQISPSMMEITVKSRIGKDETPTPRIEELQESRNRSSSRSEMRTKTTQQSQQARWLIKLSNPKSSNSEAVSQREP